MITFTLDTVTDPIFVRTLTCKGIILPMRTQLSDRLLVEPKEELRAWHSGHVHIVVADLVLAI